MTLSVAKAVRIVRAGELRPSTAEGDKDAHRKGPPPPSYGLQELTGDRARAIAVRLPASGLKVIPRVPPEVADDGRLGMGTGWHFHTCDLQLAFIMAGSIEIAYADEEWERYYAGEILVIPDHAPHNARKASGDYGLVELTFPGVFGTTECPPHPRGAAKAGTVLDDATTAPADDGVSAYLLAPHVAKVADIRLVKSGEGAVAPSAHPGMAITLVTTGRCEFEAEGERGELAAFDMVVDDARSDRTRLLARSPDFRAYQIQLLACHGCGGHHKGALARVRLRMRLVTLRSAAGTETVGALLGDDRVLDLTDASGGAPTFGSMLSLIEAGDAGLAEARRLVQAPKEAAVRAAAEVRLAAPIPRPPRMRASSLDAKHLIQARTGMARIRTRDAADPEAAYKQAIGDQPPDVPAAWYETPVYWFMDNYCVSGPDDRVTWPAYSNWIDYELEIAAVIGKRGRDVPKDQAEDYIFGYTILNDLSARDAQAAASATGLSITAKGKDFEGSYPMGPCIVTRDEIKHRDMQATLRVNGEAWGRGTPKDSHWGFDDTIAYASQASDLIPGEIFTSATVANCCGGEQARKGERGDCVEVEVEGIGVLRTWIV